MTNHPNIPYNNQKSIWSRDGCVPMLLKHLPGQYEATPLEPSRTQTPRISQEYVLHGNLITQKNTCKISDRIIPASETDSVPLLRLVANHWQWRLSAAPLVDSQLSWRISEIGKRRYTGIAWNSHCQNLMELESMKNPWKIQFNFTHCFRGFSLSNFGPWPCFESLGNPWKSLLF